MNPKYDRVEAMRALAAFAETRVPDFTMTARVQAARELLRELAALEGMIPGVCISISGADTVDIVIGHANAQLDVDATTGDILVSRTTFGRNLVVRSPQPVDLIFDAAARKLYGGEHARGAHGASETMLRDGLAAVVDGILDIMSAPERLALQSGPLAGNSAPRSTVRSPSVNVPEAPTSPVHASGVHEPPPNATSRARVRDVFSAG